MVLKEITVRRLTILAFFLACVPVFARTVSAGFPMVLDVVVWKNGADTVLNVTVSHSPQTSLHYLDRIEVNVDGDNRVFSITYRPETTFIVQCDLGTIDMPKNATIRAHCNIDGYSLSVYGPILVPEFLSMLFLPLLVLATLLTVIVYKRKHFAY